MAENEDGTEKSEEPSEKKLREAREKGDIARSIELTTLLVTLGAALYFWFFGYQMWHNIAAISTEGLSFDRDHAFDLIKMTDLILAMIIQSMLMMVPFMALMFVIATISPMLLGGWNFSTQAMAPKMSKLNPVTGLGRMVSAHALMELLKALGKFVLVGGVATFFLWFFLNDLLNLGKEPLETAVVHSAILISKAFIFISLSLIVIAMIDVPFQVIQKINELKMTQQEVKEEYKQQEGNPEVKGRIRMLQREMSQKRMMQAVPDADVVITNPTHFAIALKYNPEEMAEPMVLALGSDFMASQIRTIAKEHNIPLVEAPPLARALYYNAEIDFPIPYDLFKAVASVLAYVYQIKEGKSAKKINFADLPIPEEMKVDAPKSSL